MLKRLQVSLCALTFSLCLLLFAGCAAPSYEGTWYCVQDNGSELVLTLDKNGTCYATNGMGGNWEKTEGGFIITTSYSPLVFQDGEDGTITTIADPIMTFSKTQEQAQKIYEQTQQSKASECEERFAACKEAIRTNLVGTWETHIGSKVETAVFEDDGTWTSSKTNAAMNGTWDVNYTGDMTDEFKVYRIDIEVKDEDGNRTFTITPTGENGELIVGWGLAYTKID